MTQLNCFLKERCFLCLRMATLSATELGVPQNRPFRASGRDNFLELVASNVRQGAVAMAMAMAMEMAVAVAVEVEVEVEVAVAVAAARNQRKKAKMVPSLNFPL